MVTQLTHPLVAHWLSELREERTPPPRFRALLRRLAAALFLEAARDLPLSPCLVQTPLAPMEGRRLAHHPVLVPILRAGLGMAEGILELVPEARVCHLGLYRDHRTLEAVSYYRPTPPCLEGRFAFVLDPMLATGGSAAAALEGVKGWGVARASLLCVLGSRPGVERVSTAYPDVEVFLCGLDERLDEIGYIVPGLGDAGDRQFGDADRG